MLIPQKEYSMKSVHPEVLGIEKHPNLFLIWYIRDLPLFFGKVFLNKQTDNCKGVDDRFADGLKENFFRFSKANIQLEGGSNLQFTSLFLDSKTRRTYRGPALFHIFKNI